MGRTSITACGVALALACALHLDTSVAGARPGAECRTTIPTRAARPGAVRSAAGFDVGGSGLRVQLGWPNGILAAGILPDGASRATVDEKGAIHLKLGWWRGIAGRLGVVGRRLDGAALPLGVHVPTGYGLRGFQPTGLVFPTVGCWEVVGRVADVRLRFVVRVTKLAWH